jgi:uncharacterized protein (DUF4415 family)
MKMKKYSESSLQEERIVRSDEISNEDDERMLAETLQAMDAMSDEDIDYSDIPQITDFSGFVPNPFYRPVKDQVTLRIDRDVLAWFKASNEKYQTAINAVLREHMDREAKKTR